MFGEGGWMDLMKPLIGLGYWTISGSSSTSIQWNLSRYCLSLALCLHSKKIHLKRPNSKSCNFFSMHQWQDYVFSQNHGKCVYLVVLQAQCNNYSLHPLPPYLPSCCSWFMIENIWCSMYRRSTVLHHHHVSLAMDLGACPLLSNQLISLHLWHIILSKCILQFCLIVLTTSW